MMKIAAINKNSYSTHGRHCNMGGLVKKVKMKRRAARSSPVLSNQSLHATTVEFGYLKYHPTSVLSICLSA